MEHSVAMATSFAKTMCDCLYTTHFLKHSRVTIDVTAYCRKCYPRFDQKPVDLIRKGTRYTFFFFLFRYNFFLSTPNKPIIMRLIVTIFFFLFFSFSHSPPSSLTHIFSLYTILYLSSSKQAKKVERKWIYQLFNLLMQSMIWIC